MVLLHIDRFPSNYVHNKKMAREFPTLQMTKKTKKEIVVHHP